MIQKQMNWTINYEENFQSILTNFNQQTEIELFQEKCYFDTLFLHNTYTGERNQMKKKR
jgi:hypothetical protein